jgi:hypothetical protein
MGHSFNLNIGLTYAFTTASTGTRRGSLEWWEKTDVPIQPNDPINQWYDVVQISVSTVYQIWNARQDPSTTLQDVTVTIPDHPRLNIVPGRTVTRKLQFQFVAKSAPDCPCAKPSITLTASQQLTMVNASPKWPNSSFNTP